MSHGFLSPHWDWRNIKAGLNEADAALLQTSFFRSEALGEINRDAYYGAAGKSAIMPRPLCRSTSYTITRLKARAFVDPFVCKLQIAIATSAVPESIGRPHASMSITAIFRWRRSDYGVGRFRYCCLQVGHRQLQASQGHCSPDLPDSCDVLLGVPGNQRPVQRGYAEDLLCTPGPSIPPAGANLALHVLPTRLSASPVCI